MSCFAGDVYLLDGHNNPGFSGGPSCSGYPEPRRQKWKGHLWIQVCESHVRTLTDAPDAIEQLIGLGAHVGKRQAAWLSCFNEDLALPKADRDVIAVHRERRRLWIAEVEGDSGGQPEGNVYRALGQLVCAVSESTLTEYERFLTLVVYGDRASAHLAHASAASALGISGLVIGLTHNEDRWLFGAPPAQPGSSCQ